MNKIFMIKIYDNHIYEGFNCTEYFYNNIDEEDFDTIKQEIVNIVQNLGYDCFENIDSKNCTYDEIHSMCMDEEIFVEHYPIFIQTAKKPSDENFLIQ